jgi:Lipopolysaccharide-assembly
MHSLRLIILSTLLLCATACKVNYSMTGASISPDAKTVSVLFFVNNASLAPPTVSQKFTDALRSIMTSQTSLKSIPKSGDLSFEGNIVDYAVEAQAPTANQTTSTNRLRMTVFVKFTNITNEKQNFEQSFTRYADFAAGKTLLDVQDQLIKEINDQLVQDIFAKSATNW